MQHSSMTSQPSILSAEYISLIHQLGIEANYYRIRATEHNRQEEAARLRALDASLRHLLMTMQLDDS